MSSPVRFENGVSWFGFLQEIEAPKSIKLASNGESPTI
jgi:hypothetical protein